MRYFISILGIVALISTFVLVGCDEQCDCECVGGAEEATAEVQDGEAVNAAAEAVPAESQVSGTTEEATEETTEEVSADEAAETEEVDEENADDGEAPVDSEDEAEETDAPSEEEQAEDATE